MKTCAQCGAMLLPKKDGEKKILLCMRCGTKIEADATTVGLTDSVQKPQDIHIVDASLNDVQHPITAHPCGSCGNEEAYWWIQQTRASDEAPTRFYKCTKCKVVQREY